MSNRNDNLRTLSGPASRTEAARELRERVGAGRATNIARSAVAGGPCARP